MKFHVQMKDPDTLQDAIADAVAEDVDRLPLDAVEKALVAEGRREKVADVCRRWFKHGEYLKVEVDTEAGTCTVIPQ